MLQSSWVPGSLRAGSPPDLLFPNRDTRQALHCFHQPATCTAGVVVTIANSFTWACLHEQFPHHHHIFGSLLLSYKKWLWIWNSIINMDWTWGCSFILPVLKWQNRKKNEIYLVSGFCCCCFFKYFWTVILLFEIWNLNSIPIVSYNTETTVRTDSQVLLLLAKTPLTLENVFSYRKDLNPFKVNFWPFSTKIGDTIKQRFQ